jgi:hypothetical protein
MKRFLAFLMLILTLNISYGNEKGKPQVSVLEYALTSGIEYRQPVDNLGNKIPNTIKRLYLWTKIKAYSPPTYIYHVWYYKGEEVARIRLYIKYPIFRTWSFKTIPPQWTGSWKVVVEDVYGNPVLEKEFIVFKE